MSGSLDYALTELVKNVNALVKVLIRMAEKKERNS
jgi:hypothetical protein